MNNSLLPDIMHSLESVNEILPEIDPFDDLGLLGLETNNTQRDTHMPLVDLSVNILPSSQQNETTLKSVENMTAPGGSVSNEPIAPDSSMTNTNSENNQMSSKLNNFETKIYAFLKQDPTAKLVFVHYNNKKSLDKSTRALLTRCIIGRFRDDAIKGLKEGEQLEKFHIPQATFTALSKLIPKIFSGESAVTYYSPYQNENGVVVQTSGTLWSHYNYVIEFLRKTGVLKHPRHLVEQKPQAEESSEDKLAIQIALNTLSSSINPVTLINDWKITFNFRNIELNSGKISITDYLNKYPVLKTEDAKQLFELDFDLRYPEKKDLLKIRWPGIKSVITSQLMQLETKAATSRSKLPTANVLLIKGLGKLEEEKKDAVVFYLLQILISSANLGKRKRGDVNPVTKVTSEEIRKSFITLVKQNSELETEVEKRRTQAIEAKETLQPFVCAVGQDYDVIEEYYTVLDNQLYKVPSCIEAFDLTFKIFFSLDCAYPKQSTRLWQFLQLAGFDIVLPETVIKSVKELVGLTKKELQNRKIL